MDLQPIAHANRPAGFGLDIGMFDEAGLESALGDGGAACEGLGDAAAPDAAIQQQVLRLVGLHQRGVGRRGGVNAEQRRLRRPGNRHLLVTDREHGAAITDQGHHSLAAVAHLPIGQHRLVLDFGIDAEAVEGHVGCRQHGGEPGPQGSEIAQGEACPGMRRAHDADPQRIGRYRVRAEAVAAVHFCRAVDARQARTNRLARGRRDQGSGPGRRHHGLDDLAVARAATEYAAQRLLDVGSAGALVAHQQVVGSHQHARRTDAALCRAVDQEGFLQVGEGVVGRVLAAGETLDGLDTAAGDLAHRDQAGTDLPAVEPHGAGAAISGVAADLGTGQLEIVPQGRRQPRDRRTGPVHRLAVQDEGNLHGARPASRRRSRVTTTSRR